MAALSPDSAAKQQRRRDLAAIHAAAAKLGMDTADKSPESDYRTVLQSQGGAASAADLDAAGRKRVLVYLLRLINPDRKPDNTGGWQATKIERLWGQLGAVGALKDPSPAGLAAFIKAKHGMESTRWLTALQGSQVIEALKAMLARAQASTQGRTQDATQARP